MAIQQELWLPAIEENLYAGIELIAEVATDDSAYRNGTKIHVPNAGAAPNVTRGNTTYPVIIGERTDTDLDYSMTNFEIGPVRLGWADQLALTYNKVTSITNDFMGNLGEALRNYMLSQFISTDIEVVATTGSAVTNNWLGGSAAGSPKALKGADVRNAAALLTRDKFPYKDRYLLVDYAMFFQLIGDVGYSDARIGELAGFPITTGDIYGFKVIQLPYVAAFNDNSNEVVHVPSATDGSLAFVAASRPVALAFSKSAVSWARSPIEDFKNERDAAHFGDIMSATVWAGGKYRRTGNKGVIAIAARA